MTRDSIQGFIDGYLDSGGDPTKLKEAMSAWLEKHPAYPQGEKERSVILSDLESYRGVPKI